MNGRGGYQPERPMDGDGVNPPVGGTGLPQALQGEQPPITVDLLNEGAFLQAMKRAFDLCQAAERVVALVEKDPYTTPAVDSLENAAKALRDWFKNPVA